VFDRAKQNKLTNFTVDLEKIEQVTDYTLDVINSKYSDYDDIPPHGRWQHFLVGNIDRIKALLSTQEGPSNIETARQLIDLFTVSVLLDAGAGNEWSYNESSGVVAGRSEGLAIASYNMFVNGSFSSNKAKPYQVDSKRLLEFTLADLKEGFQVTDKNPLAGAEGRTSLLQNLGEALKNSKYFGPEGRPGYLVDYLRSHKTAVKKDDSHSYEVQLPVLWDALMEGLGPIWPKGRTKLDGTSLGDAWKCSSMPQDQGEWAKIVTFHKLTQWLCYSILVPMTKFGDLSVLGQEYLTGLPEYRNGGLLVDLGLLKLRPEVEKLAEKTVNGIPRFPSDSDVIVEWRAVTVHCLDAILDQVNKRIAPKKISLPQLLEGGTWTAGRQIAAEKRPLTSGPPIEIISDGTVF
jgi:hypothetical protein